MKTAKERAFEKVCEDIIVKTCLKMLAEAQKSDLKFRDTSRIMVSHVQKLAQAMQETREEMIND